MVVGRYLKDGSIVRASDGATCPPGHRWHDELLEMEGQGGIIEPWVPEPTAIPPITPRQMRLMILMLEMDIAVFEATVEAAINAIPDPVERDAAMTEWRWASQYERDHPLVDTLALQFGFQPAELDALWSYAANL